MRRRASLALGLILLSLSRAAVADPAVPSHDDSFSKEGLFKADVSQLKDTQLVVHPDVPLAPDQNVLWCGTLQLAWNGAIRLVGEKLTFTRPSTAAHLLNLMDFNQSDLDPGSYVAVADFERNHVEDEIRAALEKTFHGAASPELIPPTPSHPGSEDFVAYAYLYKNLAFATPFTDNDHFTFEDRPVEAFGFSTESKLPVETIEQCWICDYQSPDNFVIQLRSKSTDDQLILAKIPPGATLQATIKGVLDRVAHDHPEVAGDNDDLAVPKLNFDLRRDFPELEGLILRPSPQAKIKNKLVITQAEQLVRFQLNEKGAILKSEASMMVGAALAMMPRYSLIFDKPFLVLMKQTKANQPYFALWVGNATLLVPEASQ